MKVSNLADCPSEIETVANWYFNEWDHKDPEATLESVIEKVSSISNRTAFVAHVDGELAGAGELKYREYSDCPSYNYWLDGIYVSTEHRGKGISTALIEFAKSKAFELKIPTLYLRCEDHLVKLYESHGFQVVCVEKAKFIMELKVST
ncbi:GNAT family N-acetyltransferase [Thalassomonas viridans]|uniref:GNAT family N-acetyltransferase n=1 Tax=Thalassomonas viridans TaxID=137584 RepID=A0AAF0CC27_9GAMM|nr:GNAT family N-acetyltransferase [Thalassomonas viridans]WDE07816.1 GNAT family N-acetyltransferase [Thalassomonas viridans]